MLGLVTGFIDDVLKTLVVVFLFAITVTSFVGLMKNLLHYIVTSTKTYDQNIDRVKICLLAFVISTLCLLAYPFVPDLFSLTQLIPGVKNGG